MRLIDHRPAVFTGKKEQVERYLRTRVFKEPEHNRELLLTTNLAVEYSRVDCLREHSEKQRQAAEREKEREWVLDKELPRERSEANIAVRLPREGDKKINTAGRKSEREPLNRQWMLHSGDGCR